MKANELMIDDWVYCHQPECKGHRIDYIHEADEEVGADGEIYSINDIDPIPLTQEILEKNGFVKEEEERGFSEPYCVYVCDDFQYVIKIYPKSLMDRYSRLYIGEDDDNENVSLLINYLHELQHALKLFGIEKTIELCNETMSTGS